MRRYRVYKIVSLFQDNEWNPIRKSFILDRDSTFSLNYFSDHYTIPKEGSLILTFSTLKHARHFAWQEMYDRIRPPFRGSVCEIWEAMTHWKPSRVHIISRVYGSYFQGFWKKWKEMSRADLYELSYTRNSPEGTLGCKDLRLVRKVMTLSTD